ncbi:hypothetical protein CR983_02055 [Candidatus Saccharibacteria bacterium]|nr:MAG: hypothetical protein CR983_02055 [Candidatus Saccharibacteria bacterium]
MKLSSTLVAASLLAAAFALGGNTAYATDSDAAAPKKDADATIVTVKRGDTLEMIADKHDTTYVRIFNANDFLVSPDVINPGDKLRIPREDAKLPDRFGELYAAAPAAAPVYYNTYNTAPAAPAAAAQPAHYGYSGSTAGNTYAWGNCTWYAKNRRPDLPNMLGNGGSWRANAAARGYATGNTPRRGAIAEQAGHVAYVESVNHKNNTVTVSEMNWGGGVGSVNRRTVSANTFSGYIY